MQKPKLSVHEQIEHMKQKGITFKLMSEKEAEMFLKENTYYFKIKAYAKNYSKVKDLNNNEKYQNLDFAYLKEISNLDMKLRYLIVHMCLDIEHFLKVKLLKDFSYSSTDGYTIVKELFTENPKIEARIKQKALRSTCKDLIEKYTENFAIWNIVEVLSFGDLLILLEKYYGTKGPFHYMLESVRCLRNAASHNNCLLNSLSKCYTYRIKPTKRVINNVKAIPTIGERARDNQLRNPVIHDITVLLFIYYKVISSEKIKQYRVEELRQFFEKEWGTSREYFTANNKITSSFVFLQKVFDFLY